MLCEAWRRVRPWISASSASAYWALRLMSAEAILSAQVPAAQGVRVLIDLGVSLSQTDPLLGGGFDSVAPGSPHPAASAAQASKRGDCVASGHCGTSSVEIRSGAMPARSVAWRAAWADSASRT